MLVRVYRYVAREPKEFEVSINVKTIYNYQFDSKFSVKVLPKNSTGTTAESSVRIPQEINCAEGTMTEVMLCLAEDNVSNILKLSGPGQITKKLGAYFWSYTPDYFTVPYYLSELSFPLIIASVEPDKGIFVHSTQVKVANRLRPPSPIEYTFVVEEDEDFAVSIQELISNPDKIPLTSFILLKDSPEQWQATSTIGEIVLGESVINGGSSTGGVELFQSQHINIVSDSIVGKYPIGFVPRQELFKEDRIYWLAVFSNNYSIYGMITILVSKAPTKLFGKRMTINVNSDRHEYFDISNLFQSNVSVPITYVPLTDEAEIKIIDNKPHLHLYMPKSKFKYPSTIIRKDYLIQGTTIDGIVAFGALTVMYVHSFKPVRFEAVPTFKIYNYKKASFKLNDYINSPDNVPVSKIEVIDEGYKLLKDVNKLWNDDRDKMLLVRNVIGGAQKLLGDGYFTQDFSLIEFKGFGEDENATNNP